MSLTAPVVAQNDILVVPDVMRDPRFAGNPLVHALNIRFYAGAPLRAEGHLPIGSLCVIDTKPRDLSRREQELLQLIADGLMRELEIGERARELREKMRRLEKENLGLVELGSRGAVLAPTGGPLPLEAPVAAPPPAL